MSGIPEIVLRSSTRGQNFWAAVLFVAGSIADRAPFLLWGGLFFLLVLLVFTNKRVELFEDRIIVYRWALPRLGRSVHGYGDLKGVMYRPGAYTSPASFDLHWKIGSRTRGIEMPSDYIRSRFDELLHKNQIPTRKYRAGG